MPRLIGSEQLWQLETPEHVAVYKPCTVLVMPGKLWRSLEIYQGRRTRAGRECVEQYAGTASGMAEVGLVTRP